MIAKLIATAATVAFATGAMAHAVSAEPRVVARTAALDSIMGEVQLDALIAKMVPANATKRAAAGHRAVVAAALPGKARDRSQA